MRLHLLNALTAVSLLLCVAVCVLWVRSCFVSDRLGRVHFTPGIDSEDHHVYAQADRGVLMLTWGGDAASMFSRVRWTYARFAPSQRRPVYRGDEPAALHALGIGWTDARMLMTGEFHGVARTNLALPAVVCALPAALRVLRGAVGRRAGAGAALCSSCGYDLRATPSRCPECGRPTAATAAARDTRFERRAARAWPLRAAFASQRRARFRFAVPPSSR